MKNILFLNFGTKGAGAHFGFEMHRAFQKLKFLRSYSIITSKNEAIDYYDAYIGNNSYNSISVLKSRCLIFEIWNTFYFLLIYRKRILKIACDFDTIVVPMGHFWMRFLLADLSNKKIIYYLHDPIKHSTHSILMKFKNLILNEYRDIEKCSIVVLLSDKYLDIVKKSVNNRVIIYVSKHGLNTVYNGVTSKPRDYYANYRLNLLFFGRIDKYKGISDLFTIHKRILNDNYDVSLTVAGQGRLNLPSSKPLESCYLFNYWIPEEEISSFFSSSNVLVVLPYVDATQSGVISLAHSFGRLVLCKRVGGLADQIEEGVNGFSFNTCEEMEMKIREIYESEERQINLTKKGVNDVFNWDRIVLKMYQDLSQLIIK